MTGVESVDFIDSDGNTVSVDWHVWSGEVGLERVELSRFSVTFQNLDIFLPNFIHNPGDIIIIRRFVKHLFHVYPDFLVHLDIGLLKIGDF